MVFDFLKRKLKKEPKVIPPTVKIDKPKLPPEPYKPPPPRQKPDFPKREPYTPPPPRPKSDIPKQGPSPERRLEPIRDHDKEFLRIFKQLTYMHSPWEVCRGAQFYRTIGAFYPKRRVGRSGI